jgi:hypothetical protein
MFITPSAGTIVVALSQTDKPKLHGIGFYVLENVESLKDLTVKHESSNKIIAKSKFVTGPEGKVYLCM